MNEKVVKKCSRCKIIKPLDQFENVSRKKGSFTPSITCRSCKEGKEPCYVGKICTKWNTYKKLECFEKKSDEGYKKRCKICDGYYHRQIKRCEVCGEKYYAKNSKIKHCSSLCAGVSKIRKYSEKTNPNQFFTIGSTGEIYILKDYVCSTHRNDTRAFWFIFENSKKQRIAIPLNKIDGNVITDKIGSKEEKKGIRGELIKSKFFKGQLIGSQVVKDIVVTSKTGKFEYATRCIYCGFNYKTIYYFQEKRFEGKLTEERDLNGKCKCCETGKAIVPTKNSLFANQDKFLFSVINKEEIERTKYIGVKTNVKLGVICPCCGEEKRVCAKDVIKNQSIGCNCGRGTSYPEKIFIEMLKQLRVKFIKEYNSNNFLEGTNRRYDFYIPSKNLIIEAHGEQHYTEVEKWGSLEHTQKNDVYKKEMALDYGIENYIVIDCRKSEVDYIKQNIMISKLSKIFDLTNIDWQLCHEYATGIYKGTREE